MSIVSSFEEVKGSSCYSNADLDGQMSPGSIRTLEILLEDLEDGVAFQQRQNFLLFLVHLNYNV